MKMIRNYFNVEDDLSFFVRLGMFICIYNAIFGFLTGLLGLGLGL